MADVVAGAGGGVSAGADGFLIHSENISRYNLFDDYEDSYEFVKPIPSSSCTFGDNENFPFPALFIGSKKSSAGLVDAVLSQERRVRIIRLAGEADGITMYRGEFHQRGIEAITLEPKETLEGEMMYLEIIDKVNDYNLIFEKYMECLTKRCKFRGPKSPCVKEVIWGSWNEGIYENVTEEIVLRNARFLKKNFPAVKWVQIDAGYCRGEQGHGSASAYPSLDENVDPKKFPNGMKYVADKIKEIGLRPAIWFGLHVDARSRMVSEHPEWLLKDETTGKLLTLKTGKEESSPANPPRMYHFLDFSQEEARDFITAVFKTLIKEWGYKGIKLDFWSHTFETKRARLAKGDRTLLEWRRWFLEMIRSLLGEDGYLEIACSIGQGNPFLGRHVDNFRIGLDIGDGDWQAIKRSARWFVPDALHVSNRTLIGNSDSVSIMSRLNDAERYTWFNWCLVTRTMCEVAGDLAGVRDRSRIKELKKILKAPFNGGKTYMADFSLDNSSVPPNIWYTDGSVEDSRRPIKKRAIKFVSVINWENEVKEFEVTAAMLKLEENNTYRIKDYWMEEEQRLSGSVKIRLAPHSSKAFNVYA